MTKPHDPVARLADAFTRMLTEGRGVITLELFSPHDPQALILALMRSDGMGQALADAIPNLIRGDNDCGSCGKPLDFPASIAILRAARPDATQAVAMGCCVTCTGEGPERVQNRLATYFASKGFRLLDATHTPPERAQ